MRASVFPVYIHAFFNTSLSFLFVMFRVLISFSHSAETFPYQHSRSVSFFLMALYSPLTVFVEPVPSQRPCS